MASSGLWLCWKKGGYMLTVCSLAICFSCLFFIFHILGESCNSGHQQKWRLGKNWHFWNPRLKKRACFTLSKSLAAFTSGGVTSGHGRGHQPEHPKPITAPWCLSLLTRGSTGRNRNPHVSPSCGFRWAKFVFKFLAALRGVKSYKRTLSPWRGKFLCTVTLPTSRI
jgi:hypothetical protein